MNTRKPLQKMFGHIFEGRMLAAFEDPGMLVHSGVQPIQRVVDTLRK
jgi:hypothetical protein